MKTFLVVFRYGIVREMLVSAPNKDYAMLRVDGFGTVESCKEISS